MSLLHHVDRPFCACSVTVIEKGKKIEKEKDREGERDGEREKRKEKEKEKEKEMEKETVKEREKETEKEREQKREGGGNPSAVLAKIRCVKSSLSSESV
jgi:archaellum component FlaD/FlaE